MLFSNFSWLALAWYFATALGVTITENVISISPVNLAIGDLNINPGVYYSIVNNALTTIAGSLDNQGGFYVTSDNGLAASVSLVSGTIKNSGKLAFNSSRASVVSNYNLNSIGEFLNTGEMWFGLSGYALVPPVILGSATNWENQGKIHFVQSRGTPSSVTISNVLGKVNNEGTICLVNMEWVQTTSVEGSGCINIGENGSLQLQLSPWNVDNSQTIYLSAEDSTLSVLGLSQSLTGTKTYVCSWFRWRKHHQSQPWFRLLQLQRWRVDSFLPLGCVQARF